MSTDAALAPRWDVERIFVDGDEFFADLISGIRSATQQIQLQYYIFRDDPLGLRILSELRSAAKRGIKVQLLVDGIGSLNYIESYQDEILSSGIEFLIFKPVKWIRVIRNLLPFISESGVFNFIEYSNRRNHRKLCLIDKTKAWGGGMNVSSCHVQEFSGEGAWRDTGIYVEGIGLEDLNSDFDLIWNAVKSRGRINRKFFKSIKPQIAPDLVRLNTARKMRRKNYKEILLRIKRAKTRVWLTQAYFVPHISALRALKAATKKGVDVKILVPGKSDIFFMPALETIFELTLLKYGAKVFRYSEDRVLHAKTIQIDDWAMVGTSNFNHRSLLFDLELDFVLSHSTTRDELAQNFLSDLDQSKSLSLSTVYEKAGPFSRIGAKIIYLLRFMM